MMMLVIQLREFQNIFLLQMQMNLLRECRNHYRDIQQVEQLKRTIRTIGEEQIDRLNAIEDEINGK